MVLFADLANAFYTVVREVLAGLGTGPEEREELIRAMGMRGHILRSITGDFFDFKNAPSLQKGRRECFPPPPPPPPHPREHPHGKAGKGNSVRASLLHGQSRVLLPCFAAQSKSPTLVPRKHLLRLPPRNMGYSVVFWGLREE